MSEDRFVAHYIETIRVATEEMSRILNKQDRTEVEPFVANEDVLTAFSELIQRIMNLNDAKPGRRVRSASRFFRDSTVFIDTPRKHAPLADLEADLADCERILKKRLEAALEEPARPPFLESCLKHGLDFLEQLILAMVLIKEEDFDHSPDRMLSTNDILDTLGETYMPMEKAKEYLRADGRLRKERIIELSGKRPVVTNCYIRLNPEVLKDIYGKDYDEGIEASNQFAFDERNRPGSFPEEDPQATWESVILPDEIKEAIQNGIMQAKHPEVFMDRFGFGKTIRTGRGVSMLFSGPPGTGKTMAARAVASELGRKIIAVSYAQLESSWVGMTEKNIEKCFEEAARKGSVLLFDEADAVFYSRKVTEHSWANRDVAVILQCIEKFEGVVILTTNAGTLLDPALERRIGIKVTFPMPDAKQREAIFRTMAPPAEMLADDVDLKKLAEKYELSGGQIKNVWLNAGRRAMKRSGCSSGIQINKRDLDEAIKFELTGKETMKTILSQDENRGKGYA